MMTAQELLIRRKACFRIPTGSKQWDSILNGGFESRSVNEVYGEYRCGKTQLCHTMSVIAQLPKDLGGAEGKVAFIGEYVVQQAAGIVDHAWQIPKAPSDPRGFPRLRSVSASTPSRARMAL